MKVKILKREPGYYWALFEGKPVVAEWYHGCWRLTGQSRLVPTDDFDEVPTKRVLEPVDPVDDEPQLIDANGLPFKPKPYLVSDCCHDVNFVNTVKYDDKDRQYGVFFCNTCKKETTISEFQQLSLFDQ